MDGWVREKEVWLTRYDQRALFISGIWVFTCLGVALPVHGASVYSSIRTATAHQRTHVETNCNICGDTFENRKLLRRHYKNHASGQIGGDDVRHKIRSRKCLGCEMKFSDQNKFRDHVFMNPDHRTYQCDVCKISFTEIW